MKDYVWVRFGRWVITDNGYNFGKAGHRMVKVKCDCGKEKEINLWSLRNWDSKSCWCMRNEQMAQKQYIHWMYHTRIRRIWSGIKTRCTNPKIWIFKHYWWRWISYDPKRETFLGFYEDMWPTYKEWLEIDRIDNNGNYTKENCRWVTHLENMQHYRKCHYITYNGETLNLSQWSKKIGKHVTTILRRIKEWKPLDVVLSPKKRAY